MTVSALVPPFLSDSSGVPDTSGLYVANGVYLDDPEVDAPDVGEVFLAADLDALQIRLEGLVSDYVDSPERSFVVVDLIGDDPVREQVSGVENLFEDRHIGVPSVHPMAEHLFQLRSKG